MTDEEKRFMRRCMLMYLVVPAIMIAFVLIGGSTCVRSCAGTGEPGNDTISVRVDSIRDTIYVEIHDTMPLVREKKVVQYIKIPVPVSEDSVATDSLTLPVIQKTYSDDSTYTAYVSGLKYEQWPKLDSIIVRQRTIETIVERTITVRKKQSRWGIGVIGGYGIGIINRKPEPYIGLGVSYTILPL